MQRYALMTVLPTAPRAGLSVRYVIANPSSFAYLDASRPVYSCGKYAAHSGVAPLPPSTPHAPRSLVGAFATTAAAPAPTPARPPLPYAKEPSPSRRPARGAHDAAPSPGARVRGVRASPTLQVPHRGFSADEPGAFVCGDEAYNAWPYGLDGWVGGATVNQSIAIYPERDVSYLNGQNDTCNDGLPECDSECWQRDNEESPCFRNRMDTRCPAMLTGPWRRARGAAYMAFLRKFYGAPSLHRPQLRSPCPPHGASHVVL